MRAMTPKVREQYLEHIRAGMQRGAAADALELDRFKVREFITKNRPFRVLVEDAEVDATEHVQEALYQAATSGSVSAAKAWLELHGVGAKPPRTNDGKGSSGSSEDAGGAFDDLDVIPIQRGRKK